MFETPINSNEKKEVLQKPEVREQHVENLTEQDVFMQSALENGLRNALANGTEIADLPDVLKEYFSREFVQNTPGFQLKEDEFGNPIIVSEDGAVRYSTHIAIRFADEAGNTQWAFARRNVPDGVDERVKNAARIDTFGAVGANLSSLPFKARALSGCAITGVEALENVATEDLGDTDHGPEKVRMVGAIVTVERPDDVGSLRILSDEEFKNINIGSGEATSKVAAAHRAVYQKMTPESDV